MRATLRVAGVGVAVALPLAALLGAALGGAAGLWGALLGLVVPVGFLAATVAVGLATARSSAAVFGATVLGTWLLKVAVLVAVLAWLRGTAIDRTAFFVAFSVGVLGWLAAEAVVVARSRLPYVDDPAGGGQ